jgi:cytochrome c nitrite reductase small subunit
VARIFRGDPLAPPFTDHRHRRSLLSRFLLPLTVILLGAAVGIGAFTFVYAKGHSYLTNDPAACANCHVMEPQYAGWVKSSHRDVASCNDCHTPHDPVGKYVTKARNGFWHSFYFTTGHYPDPLRITPRNHGVTEQACRKCHAELTIAIDPSHAESGEGGIQCTSCHNEVGHIE